MRITITSPLLLIMAGSMATVSSFTPILRQPHRPVSLNPQRSQPAFSSLKAHEMGATLPENTNNGVNNDEVERLRQMAQKLRSEAQALEAERAEELAQQARLAFEKFDTNGDGTISLEELQAGLERLFKQQVPADRVETLMKDLDVSGDGQLQLEEFVGLERFRTKLEAIARDEKRRALEDQKAAQQAQEQAALAEQVSSMINDGEATGKDKLVSVIPYLLPLLDNVQFGKYLLVQHPENPFVIALGALYSLYASIPLSGFLAFFALSFLSSNLSINKLVRFNIQQAIYLDIALFVPAFLGAIVALTGVQLPPTVAELGSDAVFGALLLTIAYATASSLLGSTPDKIPFLSQAVQDRMISKDDLFDDNGNLRFPPMEMRDSDDDEKRNR